MRSWGFYLLALSCLVGLMAVPSTGVAIRLSTTQPWVNQPITLTCIVPPRAENRWIGAGLRFHQTSVRPLSGAQDISTHTFTFAHVGCPDDETWTAFCEVRRADDSTVDATATVHVVGCQ